MSEPGERAGRPAADPVDTVLRGYGAAAADLVPRYAAVESAALFAPVLQHFPAPPGAALDVGAGPGRHAGWLAAQGWRVTAVEPVAAFRAAGVAHPAVRWVDDALPALAGVSGPFRLILASAVWHHLPPALRAPAMARLAALLAPGGRLVLSLRHGPGNPSRPAWPAPAEETATLAAGCGLATLHRTESASVQADNRAAGVAWTWLVLGAPGGSSRAAQNPSGT